MGVPQDSQDLYLVLEIKKKYLFAFYYFSLPYDVWLLQVSEKFPQIITFAVDRYC